MKIATYIGHVKKKKKMRRIKPVYILPGNELNVSVNNIIIHSVVNSTLLSTQLGCEGLWLFFWNNDKNFGMREQYASLVRMNLV